MELEQVTSNSIIDEAPMPFYIPKPQRLTREDKRLLAALEVGQGIRYTSEKAARCAEQWMRNRKWKPTIRRNSDGTVNVWRAA